jgi:hypothetical protein
MSGNGIQYSEFKSGSVLPNPSVKGTEGGADQNALKSNQVGGKKSKKESKGKKTMKGGQGSCGSKGGVPSEVAPVVVMNGGKKHRKSKKRTNKRRSFLRFFGL